MSDLPSPPCPSLIRGPRLVVAFLFGVCATRRRRVSSVAVSVFLSRIFVSSPCYYSRWFLSPDPSLPVPSAVFVFFLLRSVPVFLVPV